MVTCAWAQDYRQATLAGRSVGLTLVNADDFAPVSWPGEEVSLKQISSSIPADQNIYLLLQNEGLAPDAGAFAVVYDLNPSVKDLGSVVNGNSLQLPRLIAGPKTAALIKNGALVELTPDPDLRAQISASVAAMEAFSSNGNLFASQPETKDQIVSLLQWFQEIDRRFKRRTDPPLTHDTVQQMAYEAGLLNSILKNAQSRPGATPEEQRQIASMYEDIKLDMKQYSQVLADTAPKAPSAYEVIVNIKGADQNLISLLRVYYLNAGLLPPPPAHPPSASFGFARLGSGQTERLEPQKAYEIWAAKDGDASHPVTPLYLLRLNDTAVPPVTVDLSLSGAPQK
jgi:hypothetical protein